jgi:hypothetical protein
MITAAQRMMITKALGPAVMRAAEALHSQLSTWGKADAALWRNFLQALHEGAGDEVMNSPLGLTMQLAILGKIQGDSDASLQRSAGRGSGFPKHRRQF